MNKEHLADVAVTVITVMEDDHCHNENLEDAFSLLCACSENRSGVPGRRWALDRNDPQWFFQYALCKAFGSSAWKAMIRVNINAYNVLLSALREDLTKQVTKFRLPIDPKRTLAASLMYTGKGIQTEVATQMKVGPSTVLCVVKQVSRLICSHFNDSIYIPFDLFGISRAMRKFKSAAGLPHCVGAIGGTHILWLNCHMEQHYEYRCYKDFTSLVLLGVFSADRRMTYAQAGKTEALGDFTLLNQSSLLQKIQSGNWLNATIPSLSAGDFDVRLFLLGDYAFPLTTLMIRLCTKPQRSSVIGL